MQGEKGQYGYVRQAEEKPKRSRKKKAKNTEQTSTAVDEEYPGIDGLIGPMGVLRGMVPISLQGPNFQVPTDLQNSLPVQPLLVSTPLDSSASRKSPPEEEMDEEGSEWTVKVGNAQPPVWGKRKASEEDDREGANKRMRQG
jgi:hypothetical protein